MISNCLSVHAYGKLCRICAAFFTHLFRGHNTGTGGVPLNQSDDADFPFHLPLIYAQTANLRLQSEPIHVPSYNTVWIADWIWFRV